MLLQDSHLFLETNLSHGVAECHRTLLKSAEGVHPMGLFPSARPPKFAGFQGNCFSLIYQLLVPRVTWTSPEKESSCSY